MFDRRRLISGLIALGYLVTMWQREGWPGALTLMIPLSIPLALIWYAGTLSRSKGWSRGRNRIDKPTPPVAIRTFGWVLLLAPLVFFAMRRSLAS